jgi:hypothetical protein
MQSRRVALTISRVLLDGFFHHHAHRLGGLWPGNCEALFLQTFSGAL